MSENGHERREALVELIDKVLDHLLYFQLLYIQQMAANGQQMKGDKA